MAVKRLVFVYLASGGEQIVNQFNHEFTWKGGRGDSPLMGLPINLRGFCRIPVGFFANVVN